MTMTAADNSVVLDEAGQVFILPIVDDAAGRAYFRRDDDGYLVLTHTEVPEEFGGQGIASRLARGVFDIARERGLRLVLRCPFMSAWYARHPEYGDVVAG
ncbi:GNAT family N-acetyltransferase [Novosphingobium gossypii]|uniref:GNAT family N-acetyltransferase n=1 Tax=Novosphingobium gossypii TaxID=1604774 RepID=UPI003D262761